MLNKDYKAQPTQRPPLGKITRKHWHLLAIVSAVVGVIALLNPSQKAEATRHLETQALSLESPPETTQQASTTAGSDTVIAPAPADQNRSWQEIQVERRDTLSQIFDRLQLDTRQMYAVLDTDNSTKDALTHLIPGETIRFNIKDGTLYGLQYHLSPSEILKVNKVADSYQATTEQLPIETRVTHANGVIDSSLFVAGQQAGLSDNMVMQLVGIFGWDIDFALDIRTGDTFSVLYEDRYINGKKAGDGEVVAAEFTNQGHTYRAVRFNDDDGTSHYYTPEGASLRRAFLRTPVAFSRISSRFGSRYHPILQRFRMHEGVDYAAPIGTPVKATGDGKIVFRGVKGGYGNVIILQHGGKYSTLYGHLSRFKKGLGLGSRIRQGQVIAYVGMTGLATGPHLHYEFRVNGVHTNPLTVKLPTASPIPEKEKARFLAQTAPLLAQLDGLRRTQVAQLSGNE